MQDNPQLLLKASSVADAMTQVLHIANSKSQVLFKAHDLLQILMIFNQQPKIISATFG